MKPATFEMLPNYLELIITYGTSRAKDTYGYNLVTIKEMLNSTRYQECGGGYDMLGSALGHFIRDNFQPALTEVSGHIKDFCGLSQRKDGSIYVDGGCGFNEMVKILTDLLGYEVTYEYKRDRKGRPQYKTAIILTKKNLPKNVRLISTEQVLEKPVFNVSKEYKYVSELFFRGDITSETVRYYVKKNPDAKFIALKGHSNMWCLERVSKTIISQVLKEVA